MKPEGLGREANASGTLKPEWLGRPQAGVERSGTPDTAIHHHHYNPEGVTERSAAPSGLMFGVVLLAGDKSPACCLTMPSALFLGPIPEDTGKRIQDVGAAKAAGEDGAVG